MPDIVIFINVSSLQNQIVTAMPQFNVYPILLANAKHHAVQESGFKKKGAIEMQQDSYLLETGLWRSKQESNVCIYLFILCIYYIDDGLASMI